MQTIEYRTMDKSAWGAGPWQDEPDKRQWQDAETGLPCLIVRTTLGNLCGYVGVPKEHQLHGKDYADVAADVHGGLTFAGGCAHGPEDRDICHKPEPGEPDDVWWLGFDCAHAWDLVPGIRTQLKQINLTWDAGKGDTYKDIAYVEREVTNLAKQLANHS